MREVADWQRDAQALGRCCSWGAVAEVEAAVAQCRRNLEHVIPGRRGEARAAAARADQGIDAAEAALAEQHRVLRELQERMGSLGSEHRSRVETLKAQRRAAREAQRAVAERQRAAAKAAQLRDVLAQGLKAAEAEAEHAAASELQAHQRRVHKARRELECAEEAVQGSRACVSVYEIAAISAQEAVDAAEREQRDAGALIRRLEGELASLTQGRQNPAALFGGRAAAELWARVKNAPPGAFSRPPLGPLGTLLALSDERWGLAAESALGALLSTWVVHSREDQGALAAMARGCLPPGASQPIPSIVVYSYDTTPYHIPPDQVPPHDMPTLGSVLRVTPACPPALAHLVRNLLVDYARVERTLVVGTREDAAAAMRRRHEWRQYRVQCCWAADGWKADVRGSSETLLPPDLRVRGARLGTDTSGAAARCKQALADARAESARAAAAAQASRLAVASEQQQLRQAQDRVKAAKATRARAEHASQQVESQKPEEWVGGASDGGNGALEAQRAALEAQDQVRQAEEAALLANGAVAEAEAAVAESQAAPAQMENAVEAASAAMERITSERGAAQAALDLAQNSLQQLAASETQNERTLAEAEAALRTTTSLARQMCAREEADADRGALTKRWLGEGQTAEEVAAALQQSVLEQRLAGLNDRIRHRERDAGGASLEDLQTQVAEARAAVAAREAALATANDIFDNLRYGLRVRKQKAREVRHAVAANVSRRFRSYMGARGHSGSVAVDYANKKLELHVGINHGPKTSALKTLSGGEKSMAVLALVLSLGREALSAPFQVLDEFDVYLDAVARKMALMFLLEFAHDHRDRQLIMLSPGDAAAVDDARRQVEAKLAKTNQVLPPDFCKTQTMLPPERRQSRS